MNSIDAYKSDEKVYAIVSEKVYAKVYAKLSRILVRKNIGELNISDVFLLVKEGMECVERILALNGYQKKQLVIRTLEILIDKHIPDELLKGTFEHYLAPTVDAICDVSNHKWKINLKSVNSCCFG
jgi:hypothetical protein